jgi:hypothetical protein
MLVSTPSAATTCNNYILADRCQVGEFREVFLLGLVVDDGSNWDIKVEVFARAPRPVRTLSVSASFSTKLWMKSVVDQCVVV